MAAENNRPDLGSLKIDRKKKYSGPPKRRWFRWVIALLAVIAIVLAFIAFRDDITPATSVKVATATVLTGTDAQATLVATGYVVAQRKAEVASKGTGRLEYLAFEEGDTVLQGQVIAELDNDDIEAQLDIARAELELVKVDSLQAGRSFRRSADLLKTGSVTPSQYEEVEAAYLRSKAAVDAAAAAVEVAEVALENTIIRAPFDGTVLTKNADVGDVVAPFASSATSKGSVVTMADMNSLEVEADVSEANINKVIVGQPCEIILDAYPESPYPGRVKKIVPTADRSRATVMTKVAFAAIDDRVLPEMSARVNFFLDAGRKETTARGQVVVIPNDALTRRDGGTVVFALNGEYVESVAVKTGRELGRLTEVLSGIAAGQQVVLSPPGKLQAGQKVEVTQ